MDEDILKSGYQHAIQEIVESPDLAAHVRAADRILAKLSWFGFWERTQKVRFVITDEVSSPRTEVKAGRPPRGRAIEVVWRKRDDEALILLPSDLLDIPFYKQLGAPRLIALLVLAHESFHCGELDRQTRMNIKVDWADSPFAKSVHPIFPTEASELCVALGEAFPDSRAIVSNPLVKRLADTAAECQADLLGLIAVRHAYPVDFDAVRRDLVAARRSARAANPAEYDIADALEAISSKMPSSLADAALATWKWISAEINLDIVLQQALAATNKDLPALAAACNERLSKSGNGLLPAAPLRINFDRLVSKSARITGFGKGPR